MLMCSAVKGEVCYAVKENLVDAKLLGRRSETVFKVKHTIFIKTEFFFLLSTTIMTRYMFSTKVSLTSGVYFNGE